MIDSDDDDDDDDDNDDVKILSDSDDSWHMLLFVVKIKLYKQILSIHFPLYIPQWSKLFA